MLCVEVVYMDFMSVQVDICNLGSGSSQLDSFWVRQEKDSVFICDYIQKEKTSSTKYTILHTDQQLTDNSH
jgi:hypothetical protein